MTSNDHFFKLRQAYYQGREDGYNRLSNNEYNKNFEQLHKEDYELAQCYRRGYKYGISTLAEKEFHELSPDVMFENLLKLRFRERIRQWSNSFEYFKQRYSLYYGKMKFLEISERKTEEDYVKVAKLYVELRHLYEKLSAKEYETTETRI